MSLDVRERVGNFWKRFNRADIAVEGTTVPLQAPNPPTGVTAVKNSANPTTQINVTWVAPIVDGTHAAQSGYRVYANGVQQGTDRAASATSYTITGLVPGATYAVTVKAFNSSGESSASNSVNVTLDAVTVAATLMGCSASDNDHGGTEVWDGWRIYTRSALYTYANRTGTQRPKFVAYSETGANLGGTSPDYNTLYEYCRDELDAFYYTGSAANHSGGTQSGRWGIKLYWSNGNENFDKGVLANQTTANIALYVTSQRALYDAVHFIDPVTGSRRYPDAFAGSNPTQNAEYNGQVQPWLHPSARYHDFVMWSMYPPGRQSTAADPTFNWPSFTESNRTNLQSGFLIRCYYRTFQAQAAARAETGNANFALAIGCGEVGIGDDPDDSTTRPYYAVHGLMGAMYLLADQYGLQMPFSCWWDNQSDAAAPQNILTDEPVGTNPSTRVAWQNWRTYDHRRGGTHPATWAGNPKAAWKTTGTVV